jgi:hypothetical protein
VQLTTAAAVASANHARYGTDPKAASKA